MDFPFIIQMIVFFQGKMRLATPTGSICIAIVDGSGPSRVKVAENHRPTTE